MADIITSSSGYQTGSIDTATVLVNNVSPTDAAHINGPATAIVQIETILGSGTTLKGSAADLGARLAVSLTSAGVIDSTGAAAITDSDARTNTVDTMLTLTSITSDTPAAGIGTGVLLRAESADESPSDLIQLEGQFSDVTAGSEDSTFRVKLRTAGAALSSAWEWARGSGSFVGILTHANTANRVYTFQDSSDTIVGRDTTDTLTNKTLTSPTITSPAISGNTVGTGALNTATGAASGDNAANVDVTMNDYSFFPMTYEAVSGSHAMQSYPGTDTTGTVGRFRLAGTGGGGNLLGARWRYVTASDNPTMWIAYDPATGVIKATWASDDPIPGNIPGVVVPGTLSIMLKATELEPLTILNTRATDAANLIRGKRLRMAHQAYRALQLVANDDAPSKWLMENCSINLTTGRIQSR